jgi:Flp pilus assembly protein TadG
VFRSSKAKITHKPSESGQTIVLFALVLVAVVAMVGLVIDGGATYGQRRTQQNAADMAALAAATIEINGGNSAAVQSEAQAVALANFGGDGAVVTVDNSVVGYVTVGVTAPHQNYFAGVVGQSSWQVSVTATAKVGVPTGAIGVAPIVFSVQIFDPATGLPFAPFGCATPPCTPAEFGDGNGDIPNDPNDVAWTLYGPTVNSNDLRPYLAGTLTLNENFQIGDYIGQSNGGYHNTMFGHGDGVYDPTDCDGSSSQTNVDTCLSGKNVIVPIVAPAGTICNDGHDGGCFEGWALFHVVSAEGASDKTIKGYFVSGFSRGGSAEDVCTDLTTCPELVHGLYTLRLVN